MLGNTCSHCGQIRYRSPEDLRRQAETFPMANAERILVRTILAGWPRQVNKETLIRHLWTVEREPRNPEGSIQTYVSKLNARFRAAGCGWLIKGRRFDGYTFVKAEAA